MEIWKKMWVGVFFWTQCMKKFFLLKQTPCVNIRFVRRLICTTPGDQRRIQAYGLTKQRLSLVFLRQNNLNIDSFYCSFYHLRPLKQHIAKIRFNELMNAQYTVNTKQYNINNLNI